ncbi:UNVERIFIED_CONTAM: hypothetical protein FKN15_069335 [Acipenser sinensis]
MHYNDVQKKKNQPTSKRVRGIKGVFLANQKVNGKVTTLITYNKGRDWDYLNPPSTDMNGKPVNCKPPDCHLHMHLRWADNPYVSGTVHTKDSAPGLIMGAEVKTVNEIARITRFSRCGIRSIISKYREA